MIAEVLLFLAGHSSSLFPTDHTVHPAFVPLLHPGEQQCLEALGLIAVRYRKIKKCTVELSHSPSRYISALCAALNLILKDEYESLLVETEAKVLKRDSSLVATGSFVPLSAIRVTLAEWDAPLLALEYLMDELQAKETWTPGPLIDLLLTRSNIGVHRVAEIYARLCQAVQRVWVAQLQVLLIHGVLSSTDPLADSNYTLREGSMPNCVSAQSRDAISYVGRAIGTVKKAGWEGQFPRSLALEHTKLLEGILPQDQYEFDRVIGEIRIAVSEWLWQNVLTQKDVDDAVESLANYFLLRNGEFALSLIREIERLKISRLTSRSGSSSVIREQDLNLALLRASLGTTAQHDPSLSRLRFHLSSGPLRPLLPSLAEGTTHRDVSASLLASPESTSFNDLLLGTPLVLQYTMSWPLDLFLHPSDLQVYASLFAYLSALRRTHTQIHACWTSLSNAQRARRKWTGLGDGGTVEDLRVRKDLLRCGWGVVREMNWFLETLLGYVITDVIDVEFRKLKALLLGKPIPLGRQMTGTHSGEGVGSTAPLPPSHSNGSKLGSDQCSHLDFSTLRTIHATYLDRLIAGCLLYNPALTSIVRMILEVCEQFVARVERWGGDILPALLGEGSIVMGSGDKVGEMVAERGHVLAEIDDTLKELLESFYEQLSLSTTQKPFSATADASKSVLYNMSTVNASGFNTTFVKTKRGKGAMGDEEVRRHVERLLLRLDFNGEFSKHRSERASRKEGNEDFLRDVGLV